MAGANGEDGTFPRTRKRMSRRWRRMVRGYGKRGTEVTRWMRGANFKWLSLFSKVEPPKGLSGAPRLRCPPRPASFLSWSRYAVSTPRITFDTFRRGPDVLFTNLAWIVMELLSSYFLNRRTSGVSTAEMPAQTRHAHAATSLYEFQSAITLCWREKLTLRVRNGGFSEAESFKSFKTFVNV